MWSFPHSALSWVICLCKKWKGNHINQMIWPWGGISTGGNRVIHCSRFCPLRLHLIKFNAHGYKQLLQDTFPQVSERKGKFWMAPVWFCFWQPLLIDWRVGAHEEARVGWTTAQGQRSSFLHVVISTSGNYRIIWIDFQTALKPLYAALATQGDLAEGTGTAQEDGVARAWVRKNKLALSMPV